VLSSMSGASLRQFLFRTLGTNPDESSCSVLSPSFFLASLLGTAAGENPARGTLRSFCFLRNHPNNFLLERSHARWKQRCD
jgi:hypothetical protein